jgi:hypothetical protein
MTNSTRRSTRAFVFSLSLVALAACGGGGGGGGGNSGAVGTVAAGSAPTAPSGLSAAPGNGQVSLTWATSANAVSYNVYIGTTAGGESSTAAASAVAGTNYTAAGLSNGTAYYFKIAAVNSNGTSLLSSESSATPAISPSAPANVIVTPADGQLALSWSVSPNATSYSVYQGRTSGGESPSPVATGLTSPAATITGLTNGGIYFYTVTATNIDVTGPASIEIAAVPVATPVANGQLAAGVVVLSAAQNGQIVSETASLVTFTGAISIPQGTVFLTADNAYIADNSTGSNGQTLVSVHEPQVSDVFSSLQIVGTFPLTSDAIVTSAGRSAGRSATAKRTSFAGASPLVTGTLTQTYPINFSSGGFSASGNLTANITVNINFDYSSGALQSANVTVNQTNQTSITAAFTASAGASTDFPITTFSIPIPVSVVDSLLNALGVKVAAIQVPVSVLLSGRVQFNATAIVTGSSQAIASASYTSGATPSVTGTLSGDTSFAVDPSSVSTTGDDVVATLQANAALYLHLRPALAFLNTVALLGADVQAGPSAQLDAQIVAETPPYCLEITKSLNGQVSGFFKTIGLNVATSSLNVSKALPPPVYVGSCALATNVTATFDSSSLPATYYSPILVDVSVTPQSSSQAQGKIPTNTVTVSMNGNTCTATLGTGGSGSCTLPASPAGTAVPYQLSYNGDTNFSPSTNSSTVDVGQSNTITGLMIPAMNNANTPIDFSASVAASPAISAAGSAEPSGTINIDDPSGATLCLITLNSAATGTCNVTFTSPVSEMITARYSGDTNYLASNDTATLVVVDSPIAVTLTASQPSVPLGAAVSLTWTSTNANACAESGGASGDLWGGTTVLLNGTQPVIESSSGTYTYTMTCTSSDGTMQGTQSTTVTVTNPWVGNWDGNITSTCGYITGAFDIVIVSNGGNQLSLTDEYGDAYGLTISSTDPNAASSTLDGGIYYTISGTSMTVSEPMACQTGTLTKQ